MLKKHIVLSINTYTNVQQLVIHFGNGEVFISLHQQCLSQSKLSLSLSSSSSPPLLRQLSLNMFSRYLLTLLFLLFSIRNNIFENIFSVVLLEHISFVYYYIIASFLEPEKRWHAFRCRLLHFGRKVTVFGGSSLTNPSFQYYI